MNLRKSIFLVSLFFSYHSFAQSLQENIDKYWNYRDRFVKNFIVIGDEPGESLAFNNRNDNAWNADLTGTSRMELGEFGTNQGYYLAVLATEYALLQKEGKAVNNTLKELFYAMYAFNRLDYTAETYFGNKDPSLDGFFVRNDIPRHFVQSHPELNDYCLKTDKYKDGSGEPFLIKNIYHEENTDRDCFQVKPTDFCYKYLKSPMSLDQAIEILQGLFFVYKFVDGGAKYQDKKFQDGETYIQKEVQNIVHRIISFAESQNWLLKDPDGDFLGTCEWTDKTPSGIPGGSNGDLRSYSLIFTKIGKRITGKDYKKYLGPVSSITQLVNHPASYTENFNARMFLMGMLMSDQKNAEFLVIQHSLPRHWTPFYHTIGVLLNGWKKTDIFKTEAKSMLDSAPFQGPYYHNKNDYAQGGWANTIRFDSEFINQLTGAAAGNDSACAGGNYSGIDYMFLHNIYLLAYESPSSFTYFKGNNVFFNPYAGDFNNDGKTDLLFTGPDAVAVSIYTNGKFDFQTWFRGKRGIIKLLSVGDFDGDGKDDVINSYLNEGIKVFLSSGNSFLPSPVWSSSDFGAEKLWTVGNFNGDNYDDILRTVSGVGVQVLLSTGSSFQPPEKWTGADFGTAGKWVVGDFDGNKKDDIARYINGVGTEILLSNGSSFLSPKKWTREKYGPFQTSWEVGDFDRNGKDDLLRIVPRLNKFDFEILISNGNGFSPPQTWMSLDYQPLDLIVGDLNGDGASDVIYRYHGKRYGALASPLHFSKPVQIDSK